MKTSKALQGSTHGLCQAFGAARVGAQRADIFSNRTTMHDKREPPAPPGLVWTYSAWVKLGRSTSHGLTPRGKRAHVSILSGHFEGPGLRGRVLPGGADWQTERSDGCTELLALYDMACDDGTLIHVRNTGLWYPVAGRDAHEYVMSQPVFDVPMGPHDWLNQHLFLATIGSVHDDPESICLDVFRVTMPGDAAAARPRPAAG